MTADPRYIRVAIVGSAPRREWSPEQRARYDAWLESVTPRLVSYINQLPADAVVISGGAAGIDTLVETTAKARGLEPVIFHADWRKHGKGAGPLRNSEIVASCERVLAFVFEDSSGTMDTVTKARAAGKRVVVVGKDDEG